MKYLVVQDWRNTHGNHAGMVHMCRLLEMYYPNEYKVIINPQPDIYHNYNERKICRLFYLIKHYLTYFYSKYQREHIITKKYLNLCASMFKTLKSGDEVFLMEYLFPEIPQLCIAKYLRLNNLPVKIYALSHLTPTALKLFGNYKKMIKYWLSYVDKSLTLGNSLSEFFIECGIKETKISTGFHYVDIDFYKPTVINEHEIITIIVMGSLQRDYVQIAEVVNRTCSYVRWIICRGNRNVDFLFKRSQNVIIEGYLQESSLRERMSEADISLNVLQDTVGSNVITTSMAMGLAIIATDVGSIRDYCSAENSILCKAQVESYIFAIDYLHNNRQVLSEMKKSSLVRSRKFSIENVHKWFMSLS